MKYYSMMYYTYTTTSTGCRDNKSASVLGSRNTTIVLKTTTTTTVLGPHRRRSMVVRTLSSLWCHLIPNYLCPCYLPQLLKICFFNYCLNYTLSDVISIHPSIHLYSSNETQTLNASIDTVGQDSETESTKHCPNKNSTVTQIQLENTPI